MKKKIVCSVGDETFEIDLSTNQVPTKTALKLSVVYGKMRWFLDWSGSKQHKKIALVTESNGCYQKYIPIT